MNYWLVKQEPEDYSWADLEEDGRVAWTGVRNFQARNFLRQMKRGDLVLFYHSGAEKRVVAIARVERGAYPDPTTKEGDWASVDLQPYKALKQPVSLSLIKGDRVLKGILLARNSRLSVMPLTEKEFKRVIELSQAATRQPE